MKKYRDQELSNLQMPRSACPDDKFTVPQEIIKEFITKNGEKSINVKEIPYFVIPAAWNKELVFQPFT